MFPSDRDELSHEVMYGLDKNRVRIIRRWQVDYLVGKMLTYIEATFTDATQRKAHKDLTKQTIYNWFMDTHEDFLPDGVDFRDAINDLYKKHEKSTPVKIKGIK